MEDFQSSAPRRVEAYLDTVLASLPRRLSAFDRDELRREIRTHLWERVAAYEELGQAEDDAVTEALSQFGGGKDFVKQWRREWTKTPHRMTLRDVYLAGRQALLPSLTGIVGVNAFYLAAQECVWRLPKLNAFLMTSSYNDMVGWSMAVAAFVLVPLLVGIKCGRQTAKCAGVGLAAALAAEAAVTGIIYGAFALGANAGATAGTVDMLFNFLIGMTVAWIPVAGGAAMLTNWWKRRVRARQVA